MMSNVGSMNAGPGRNAIGALKFSPDGKQAGRRAVARNQQV